MKWAFLLFIPRIIFSAVYGVDNRIDLNEYRDEHIKSLALSTAAMIYHKKFIEEDGSTVFIEGGSLELEKHVCQEERFSQNFTAAKCSGFLVSDRHILTAGHCIKKERHCQTFKWVFDFTEEHFTNKTFDRYPPYSIVKVSLPKQNVFHCKKIISRSFDKKTKLDYALIELDRPVPNRTPLKLSQNSELTEDQEFIMIGHPSGLTTKITEEGYLLKKENINPNIFKTNLDAFHGNSGSPVINKETGLVEGLLIRGENDYVGNYCKKVKVCDDESDCRGEDVLKMSRLLKFIKLNMKNQGRHDFLFQL
jgi:V8-like Glu-specific endopeptidase